MALAALAADADGVWTRTVQHRFGGTGALAGHSVGNLILAGLTEVLGDPVAALDEVARMLRITGRVLPMSPIALDIEADVSGLEADPRVSRCIRGQVAIATTPGKVRRVRLIPSDPPASPEATSAIEHADVVVLGPGSWFTSVIPHVLVPELREALVYTRARKVLVLNLAAEPGRPPGSPRSGICMYCPSTHRISWSMRCWWTPARCRKDASGNMWPGLPNSCGRE